MATGQWLFSKRLDLLVLFLPVWVTWVLAFVLPTEVINQEVTLWIWVVFVIGIDVSHVWSTIFRTYLDKEEFRLNRSILIWAPVVGFLAFFGVASISSNLFWSILAYLAVFHFVKQQFGFMRLYQAKSVKRPQNKWINDKTIIYLGMLFPVFYWHINSKRAFSWFVDGDFLNFGDVIYRLFGGIEVVPIINTTGIVIYWVLISYWLIREMIYFKNGYMDFPIGKVLWVLSTAINWYLGIVYFNSDFVFTVTNVVAHGVPYLALIFFYVEKKKVIKRPKYQVNFRKVVVNIGVMLFIVLVLAFGEEYLWDMLMYRDNEPFFEQIFTYPMAQLSSPYWQALALALLSLPQVTHYILDGFIWKSNKKNPYLKEILFN
ncbi:MAG: hypothetical protein AAFN93_09530 [Bacteroidota bacterium]